MVSHALLIKSPLNQLLSLTKTLKSHCAHCVNYLHRGYFQTAEQRFLIEPLSEDGDGDHAVSKYEDALDDTPRVCGVTNTTWDESEDGAPPRILKTRSRSSVRLSIRHYKNQQSRIRLKD